MTLGERVRALLTPDRSRWQPMLMGLAVCAIAGGAAAAFQPPKPVEAVLLIVALAAWAAGACAMVGYVRWFFASEMVRAKRDSSTLDERNSDR